MALRTRETLIFERSVPGKTGMDLPKLDVPAAQDTRPAHLTRSAFDGQKPPRAQLGMIRRTQSSGKQLLALLGRGCRLTKACNRYAVAQRLENIHKPPPAFTVSAF